MPKTGHINRQIIQAIAIAVHDIAPNSHIDYYDAGIRIKKYLATAGFRIVRAPAAKKLRFSPR